MCQNFYNKKRFDDINDHYNYNWIEALEFQLLLSDWVQSLSTNFLYSKMFHKTHLTFKVGIIKLL